MWTDEVIAVDWGTTNRRAYRLTAAGECLGEFEDNKGVTSVERNGFPAAIAEIRERLGDLPLLMAGMIGSNRGWVEVPYVHCPAGAADLAGHLVFVHEERAAIVPGLSYLDNDRADVMRGEEVQLFGAVAAGLAPPDCLVCHPGTHNKWARMENGRVTSFRTVMTGELFSMLQHRSIISEWLDERVVTETAFRDGVRRGLQGDAVTAELFSVRASVLLRRLEAANAASFTSGLLIGADIRTGLAGASGDAEVIVMGRPELTALYAAALREIGRSPREVDGERAFVAGICDIARTLK